MMVISYADKDNPVFFSPSKRSSPVRIYFQLSNRCKLFERGVSAEENRAIRRRVPLHGKTDRLLKLSNFVAMHIIKKRYFIVFTLFNK